MYRRGYCLFIVCMLNLINVNTENITIWKCCQNGHYFSEKGCVEGNYSSAVFKQQNLLFNHGRPFTACDGEETNMLVSKVELFENGTFDFDGDILNNTEACLESYHSEVDNATLEDIVVVWCIPVDYVEETKLEIINKGNFLKY